MAKLSLGSFIRSQRLPAPPPIRANLTGQTIIVTGANSGLGLGAAKQFAIMNPARLILACRSRERGEAAIEEIKRETGYANAELKLLDLSRFASVSAFADELNKEDARLDVLLANAGIASFSYEQTADGLESTVQVNHLATALLSLLLLPRMIKTAQSYNTSPRLSIVSSETHLATHIQDDLFAYPNVLRRLSDPSYCTTPVMYDRYNVSKLLNVLFSRALTSHLPPASPLIVNAVNPGFCYSAFHGKAPFAVRLLNYLLEPFFARPTAVGSSILVWACLAGTAGEASPDLRDKLRGAYVSDWEISEPSDFVLSGKGQESQARIWRDTIEILEQQDSRVREIVDNYLRTV